MKTVYSFALTILLIVGSITPVFAIEEPNVQVSTVEELKEAIANASDGDTIKITQTIQVLAPNHIGDSSKSITLCGSDSTETLLQFLGEADTNISVENITIDGEHSANGSKILVGTNGNVLFDSVDWRNCVNLKDQGQGGALCVELGNVTLTGCSFVQCHASASLDAMISENDKENLLDTIADERNELEEVDEAIYWAAMLPPLTQAFATLTKRQQEILVSIYCEGNTHEVTAKKFGISKGGVSTIARGGMNKLRNNAALLAACAY